MAVLEAACAFVILLFLVYRYLTATYSFWKERGVPGPEPVLFFGTMKDIILKKEFAGYHWKRMYDTYEDAQFVGLFKMRQPILIIKDPKHIKDVFIKDSAIFSTRGLSPLHLNAEPLQRFIFCLDEAVARPFRTRVSPAFTPNKLKEIFTMMQECFVRLENYMEVLLSTSDCVNCTDVSVRLTADIIGSCFIGTDLKTLSTERNEVNKFLFYSEVTRNVKGKQLSKYIFREMLPQLYDFIGFHLFDNDIITNFYTDFVLDLMQYRKKHNIVKNDFLGLLMELRDNPEYLDETTDTSDYFYAAQLFGFLNAGHEGSAMILNNTLYELALNHNIQDKLRDEIRNFYFTNGQVTYDNINSMTYLSAVFKETVRKYPGADSILRKSSSSYTFKDTKVTIPRGQTIIIPVYAIHHDPKIYPEPEIYDPDRFNEEVVRSRDPMHHIPFGYGIRNCIGERLGILQTKMSIVAFLRKYKVDVCDKTITSYKYHFMPLILETANPIYLKITKINLFE